MVLGRSPSTISREKVANRSRADIARNSVRASRLDRPAGYNASPVVSGHIVLFQRRVLSEMLGDIDGRGCFQRKLKDLPETF